MWRRACPLTDLRGGEMRPFELGGLRLLLVNNGGVVSAFPDRCLHQGVPLSRGRLARGVITCWAHEWQYDAQTGAGINPDNVALARCPVEVRDGEIWVDLPCP